MAALAVVLSGCLGNRQVWLPATVDAPAETDIESTLLLLGDAGAAQERDPVLSALSRQIGTRPARTAVLFLGDNIYPEGLPPTDHPGRSESERRLAAQVAASRGAHRQLFIPGNHDWMQTGRPSDWDSVTRQAALLRATGDATLHPPAGCPGPEVIDIGLHLRLVVLDTEWWLHGRPLPTPDRSCHATTADEVVSQIGTALSAASPMHVIIAGHHPPVSAGPHGGHFDTVDHLFPLRMIKPWMWIPLPVVGSAYPLARRAGATVQDQSHATYQRMVAALRSAIAPYAPMLFAAGHEHQLGLFDGAPIGTRYVAVSGAGMVGHERGAVGRVAGAAFASRIPGFMRLDVLRDGRVRLTVVQVIRGTVVEDLQSWWL